LWNSKRNAAEIYLHLASRFRENPLLNSFWLDMVHASTYLLKRKIATFLPDHVDSLVASARKFGVHEVAAKELNRLKKRRSAQWGAKKANSRSVAPV
jgi:hypothetical protein